MSWKIILPVDVEAKINYWVDRADKEVSGLGDAEIDLENKTILIKSAFMLEQECTATETEMDENAVMIAMHKAHQDTLAGTPRDIKFWWHSHVNMGVFWSGTDKKNMEMLSGHGWFCHIVFNKKRERKAALTYPVTSESLGVVTRTVGIIDDIPIASNYRLSNEVILQIEQEFEDNYSERGVGNYSGPTEPKPVVDEKDTVYLDKKCLIFWDKSNNLKIWVRGYMSNLAMYPERIPAKALKKMHVDDLKMINKVCVNASYTDRRALTDEMTRRKLPLSQIFIKPEFNRGYNSGSDPVTPVTPVPPVTGSAPFHRVVKELPPYTPSNDPIDQELIEEFEARILEEYGIVPAARTDSDVLPGLYP